MTDDELYGDGSAGSDQRADAYARKERKEDARRRRRGGTRGVMTDRQVVDFPHEI